MIKREIYFKPDNGSRSEWRLWDGISIYDDYLYSCGEAYVHTVLLDGEFCLKYRPFASRGILPDHIGKKVKTEDEIRKAIIDFADWAIRERREIIAEMESYEE